MAALGRLGFANPAHIPQSTVRWPRRSLKSNLPDRGCSRQVRCKFLDRSCRNQPRRTSATGRRNRCPSHLLRPRWTARGESCFPRSARIKKALHSLTCAEAKKAGVSPASRLCIQSSGSSLPPATSIRILAFRCVSPRIASDRSTKRCFSLAAKMAAGG